MKHNGGFVVLGSLIFLVILAVFYDFSPQISSALSAREIPCFDRNRPERQSFTVKVSIVMDKQSYPIDAAIGHDANCLRDIHTDDRSGTVQVQSNQSLPYTLGDFFHVWKKTFNDNHLFDTEVDLPHTLRVLVNGKSVSSYGDTQLMPNQKIEVIYQ